MIGSAMREYLFPFAIGTACAVIAAKTTDSIWMGVVGLLVGIAIGHALGCACYPKDR